MSTYELLLTLHILAIVVWVGGGLVLHVFALRARATGDPGTIGFAFVNAGWIGQRFFTTASAIALVTGLLLVNELDLSLGEPWISFGLAVLVASALVGALYLGPTAEKLGKAGVASPGFEAGYGRLLRINRVELTLLLLVIVAMVAKPGA